MSKKWLIFLLCFGLCFIGIKAEDNYSLGKIIGYKDSQNIDAYIQSHPEVLTAMKTKNWLFLHASVGRNTLDGMNSIFNEQYPTIVQIPSDQEAAFVNSASGGKFYEMDRGNPGFEMKLQYQKNSTQLWNGHLNFIISKMCYIDINGWFSDGEVNATTVATAKQLAQDYINVTKDLSSQYPTVTQIYTTMPLEIDGSLSRFGILRYAYNKVIRDHCRTNNLPLFDIADIESKSTVQNVNYNGTLYQTEFLNSSFASDSWGHLNDAGQQAAARGMKALMASTSMASPVASTLSFDSSGKEVLIETNAVQVPYRLVGNVPFSDVSFTISPLTDKITINPAAIVVAADAVKQKYTITVSKNNSTISSTLTLNVKSKLGDANDDGEITVDDIVTIAYDILGIHSLAGRQFSFADVSKDGAITVTDIYLIQQHVLEVISIQ